MKTFRILFVVIVVGACCVTSVLLGSHPAWADNAANDKPAAAALPRRFQVIPSGKDPAPDELHILDTATGKLYALVKRAKPKDKEPTYEWLLIADAPK